MGPRRIRWGILSTSNIGAVALIPAIRKSRNGEVRAVASRDLERARAFAAKHEIPRAYGSYPELLEAEDVDAIYNPLPNNLHCEWTVRAAEAGKHVLCEKPLAMNASECDAMDRAATAHGVKLMEAFMYRFHPRTMKVVELIRSGVIGPLESLQASFRFRLERPGNIRLQPELGGGALMDVGCYCVNLARTLAGAEPVEAQAFAVWAPTGVDARMAGTLRFETGLLAQFDCALTHERRETYVASGPLGDLVVCAAFVPGTGETVIEEMHARGEATRHLVPGADEYREMTEHFADAVLGATAVRYPAAEASDNMRAIEALYRSARNGGRPEPV